MNYGYVYIHTNKTNGKKYVGQSTQDPKRRFRKTQNALNSYRSCPAMFSALNKYGWDNFETEIVYHAFDQVGLNKAEEYFIDLYKSADGVSGYNMVSFSEGRGKQAESTKDKIREKRRIYIEKMGGLGPSANRKEYRTLLNVVHKHCSHKNHWVPIVQFNKYKLTWDGLNRYCQSCHREVSREQKSKRRNLLSSEEIRKSYENRKEAISVGVRQAFNTNEEYRQKHIDRNKKKILRIDPVTNDIKEYESGIAVKADGFDNTYVSQCCTGKRKMFKGFKWEFKKETGPSDPDSTK